MKNLIEKASYHLNSFLLAGVVFAQSTEKKIDIQPPAGFDKLSGYTVPQIVTTVIRFTLIVAAVIAFIFLVWGGIKWITSGGDKEGTAKAQSTITAALVGLVIVFAAWAIMQLLSTFFGLTILENLNVPTIGE